MDKRILDSLNSPPATRSPLRRIGLSRNVSSKFPAPLAASSPIVAARPNDNQENQNALNESITDTSLISNVSVGGVATQETPKASQKRKLSLSLTFNPAKRARWREMQKEEEKRKGKLDFGSISAPEKKEEAPKEEEIICIDSTIKLDLTGFSSDEETVVFAKDAIKTSHEAHKVPQNGEQLESSAVTEVVVDTNSKTVNEVVETTIISKKKEEQDDEVEPKNTSTKEVERDEKLETLRNIVKEKRERALKLQNHIKRTTEHRRLIKLWKAAGVRALQELTECYRQSVSVTIDITQTILHTRNIRPELFGYNPKTRNFN